LIETQIHHLRCYLIEKKTPITVKLNNNTSTM